MDNYELLFSNHFKKIILSFCCIYAFVPQIVFAQNISENIQSLLSHEIESQMVEWFLECDKADTELPTKLKNSSEFSIEEASKVKKEIWDIYCKVKQEEQLLPAPEIFFKDKPEFTPKKHLLALGEKNMPYYFVAKGNVFEGKRPLFISLHGGGSDKKYPGKPHASEMNNREWRTQLLLFKKIFPDNALYFIPRMADDHDGRWYYDYCQDAYETVIRQAIQFHNVDPDRVYLIGISEGAYTAYRMGAFMSDRLAGANSMAGGEPFRNAPPVNMRNIAFRADIGEFDKMFDRLELNKQYADSLQILQQLDTAGYVHSLEIHKGKGHGIDYRPGPEWIYNFKRNPYPNRVVWEVVKVHGRYKPQFYWLALPSKPTTFPIYIDASIDRTSNNIYVKVGRETKEKRFIAEHILVKIYLNDKLVDLDKPIHVTVNNGKKITYVLKRTLSTMMHSLAERGDPRYIFPAEIVICGAD